MLVHRRQELEAVEALKDGSFPTPADGLTDGPSGQNRTKQHKHKTHPASRFVPATALHARPAELEPVTLLLRAQHLGSGLLATTGKGKGRVIRLNRAFLAQGTLRAAARQRASRCTPSTAWTTIARASA